MKEERLVFEFPYVENGCTEGDARDAGYVVPRMQRLTEIAATLGEAGWTVWFTLTGLAFEPPGGFWWVEPADDESDDDPMDEVCCLLEDLGIEEDIHPASRTASELRDAYRECSERVFYSHMLGKLNDPGRDAASEYRQNPSLIRTDLQIFQRLEQKYAAEEPLPYDDYSCGFINGKVRMLEWLWGMDGSVVDWERDEPTDPRLDDDEAHPDNRDRV